MSPIRQLVAAMLALVALTMLVGMRMLFVRIAEMRQLRIHPQAVATSLQSAARYENVQASDNFRNLSEVPILFYALCATALAVQHTPAWLAYGAWAFVGLRYAHSLIQCTYNRVMHRFLAFISGFTLLIGLWIAFFVTWPA
jgi:hypothetical protein